MRLWAKIFLWFWLAMVLVAGCLVLSVYLTSPDRPGPHFDRPMMGRFRRFTAEAIRLQVREVAQIYQQEGNEGARRYLERMEEERGVVASLYGREDRLIAGPALAGEQLDVVRRARGSGRMEFLETRGTLLVARRPPPFLDRDGLVLVGSFPRPGAPVDPWGLALRLLAVLLPGGLVCYWLARYLTSPATKLQKAVQQLASGQLETRVGESLGGRRDELADLARDFDAMAERIQQLVESQNRLIRDISHELRSPLARLNVALELTRRRAGPGAEPAVERIAAESERMNQLIGQLLHLSRLETAGQDFAAQPVELAALLEKVVADAAFEASSRECKVELKDAAACQVSGSADLLRSAFENVIRNAVGYSPPGGTVRVQLEADDASVAVRVQDRGPGVPGESLERIFEPFFRVGEARDRDTGGSGLGLAIASRIIRLHRGSIAARNLEPGLEVRIDLPRV